MAGYQSDHFGGSSLLLRVGPLCNLEVDSSIHTTLGFLGLHTISLLPDFE